MSEPMTCAEAEPLLPLVADGAIDPDSDPTLFTHLAGCPDCQRAVASHDLIALAIARAPRRPQPQRRATILRFLRGWPYAAAAGLALAAGAWLVPGGSRAPAVVAAAVSVMPATAGAASPILAQPAIATPRDVIAVPRPDGSTLYLVRQGETWLPLDPSSLDGPVSPSHSGGSGIQVRY